MREQRSQPQGEELFIVEGEDGSSWLVTTGGLEEQLEGGNRPVSTGTIDRDYQHTVCVGETASQLAFPLGP